MNAFFALIAAALISAVCAAAFLFTFDSGDSLAKRKRFFERLPRHNITGGILAVLVLAWCIPNLRPVFAPDSPFQKFILPVIVIGCVLVCIYLDYLFARAFAAFLILGAHAMLKLVYPYAPAGYTFFAVFVLTAGVIGIVLSAKPHWFRNWFRLSFRYSSVRWSSFAFFAILAALSILCVCELPK